MRGLGSRVGGEACAGGTADEGFGEQCWMDERMEDAARRVAHVAIVHWRVFGGLVYLRWAGVGDAGGKGGEGLVW